MRSAPRKVFILEDRQYIEVGYDYYLELKERNKKRRFLLIGGMLLEVPEEQYRQMGREENRRRYLEKLAKTYEGVSYVLYEGEEMDTIDVLPDDRPGVDEIVERRLMLEKLGNAMKQLSKEELQLIHALFFENQSERKYASQKGISQVSIHKRKHRVLGKLRKMLEKERN